MSVMRANGQLSDVRPVLTERAVEKATRALTLRGTRRGSRDREASPDSMTNTKATQGGRGALTVGSLVSTKYSNTEAKARETVQIGHGITVLPASVGRAAMAGRLRGKRVVPLPAGQDRSCPGRKTDQGHRETDRRSGQHGEARRRPDRLLPFAWSAPAGQAGGGPASTPIPSGGCANGSSPRSLLR